MQRSLSAIIVVLLFATTVLGEHHVSDREVAGLRGKVQKVVTESAKLTNESGKWVEGKALLEAVTTYDLEGNALRREVYRLGNLSEVQEYGFLEGDRVLKITRVGPDNLPSGSAAPKVTPDLRYTFRFNYKYDNKGNRIEELWYGNDTSLRRKTVNIYDEKGNRVEQFTYTPFTSQPSSHSVWAYDDKGNVIEENFYGIEATVRDKWSFSYEFDSNGNWIKRKRMKWITKEGKSYFEPYDVTYRSVTYF